MYKKIILISSILLSIFLLSACTSKKEEYTIYTTVYPLEFIVTEIVNSKITVKSVLPNGVDAHDYEPTTKEIINIGNSKLLFALGEYEFYLPKLKETLSNQYVKVHEIEDALENHEHVGETDDYSHSHEDLHIWMDISNMIHMTEEISSVLINSYPKHQDTFKTNTSNLISRLELLENDFNQLKSDLQVPTPFITTHGAFTLWEKYNLEEKSILGKSGHDEPTQQELTNLIEFAKNNNIKYVFYEQNISSSYGDIILNGINGEKKELHNLSNLTETNRQNNEDYITLMKNNLSTLKSALL